MQLSPEVPEPRYEHADCSSAPAPLQFVLPRLPQGCPCIRSGAHRPFGGGPESVVEATAAASASAGLQKLPGAHSMDPLQGCPASKVPCNALKQSASIAVYWGPVSEFEVQSTF